METFRPMKHFTKASKELRALANTLNKKAITSDPELEKLIYKAALEKFENNRNTAFNYLLTTDNEEIFEVLKIPDKFWTAETGSALFEAAIEQVLEKLHVETTPPLTKEELTEAMNAAKILDDLADKFGYELCLQISNMSSVSLEDNNAALLANGLSIMRYKYKPDELYIELFE
jgi:hypothetical protein